MPYEIASEVYHHLDSVVENWTEPSRSPAVLSQSPWVSESENTII
jgi:hypothetical protein